jgi:hypothetical protein
MELFLLIVAPGLGRPVVQLAGQGLEIVFEYLVELAQGPIFQLGQQCQLVFADGR